MHRRSAASVDDDQSKAARQSGESPIFQAPSLSDAFQPDARSSVAGTNRASSRATMSGSNAAAGEDGWTDKSALTWTDRNGDSYSYRENPLIQVCPFILAQECCERLAFYGINPTLKPYLKKSLGIPDAKASSLVEYFQGLIYLPPIFSAILSDSKTGTYKTILIFSVVYALGLGTLVLSAIDGIGEPWMVYLSIFVLITIGSGGIKSCVNVLGAQQFHPTLQKTAITSFFTYFYASINVGSIVGGIAVPQTADSVSYAVAYVIPLVSFILASIVFVIGTKRYVRIKPQGSPVVAVVKVIYNAARLRGFENAKMSNGGPCETILVDDTLGLLRLLPVVAMVMPLLMAYNQMTTAFLTQGEKMKSEIFGTHFAPALMQTIDPLAVVTATFFLEKLLFTYLRKIDRMPSIMTRFAIGNGLGCCALLAAFFVELAVMAQDKPNTLSIWWQVPQFSLIATAEIFTISTSYEVAFTLAPTALKTVSSACNLIFFSISGLLAGVLFVIFEGWMPDFHADDPKSYKDAHYDYYFLVLAGVCVFGVIGSCLLRPYFRRITSVSKHVVPDDDENTRATALEERTVLLEE